MSKNLNLERRAFLVSGIVLAVIFVAGAIAGSATTQSGLFASTRPSSPPDAVHSIYDLELTEEQRLAVESILARRQPRVDSIVGAAIDSLRAAMGQADADIRALLTPEQIEAYDALVRDGPRIQAVRRIHRPAGVQVDTVR